MLNTMKFKAKAEKQLEYLAKVWPYEDTEEIINDALELLTLVAQTYENGDSVTTLSGKTREIAHKIKPRGLQKKESLDKIR